MSHPEHFRVCVVGGTNVANALTRHSSIRGQFRLVLPYGASPLFYWGEVDGLPYCHVPLHGFAENILGEETDGAENHRLRLTWQALHQLGVQEVLGGATAGWLNPLFAAGDWVVPDDFFDLNISRPRSLANKILPQKEVEKLLPRLNPAVDPELHKILVEETRRHSDAPVHTSGVVAQPAGARFETPAEVRMLRLMGGDVVTLTIASEMAYARQLGMNFAALVGVVNPGEGLAPWTWESVASHYPRMHAESVEIYLSAIPRAHALAGQPRVGDDLRFHPDIG